ncbi:MAG: ABC transporter substrate-binding protein [Lachnospirales bacterium]
MKKKLILSAFLISTIFAVGCSSDNGASAPSESTTSSEVVENETSEVEPVDDTEETILTIICGGSPASDSIQAIGDQALEDIGIGLDVEYRPDGGEGDNLIKTRLAAGNLNDLLSYNTGAKFGELNPSEYFIDLTDTGLMDSVDPTFAEAVTIDGVPYGVPKKGAPAGVIMYNRDVYEEYGLEVPKTWDEFLANCDALLGTGVTPIIGSFADAWTTQVVFLGDNYNVVSQDPNFVDNFTAGTDKFATNPAGLSSFQKAEETIPYYNADATATSYADGCEMLLFGDGAHYIMVTDALAIMNDLYPEEMDNVGIFAVPGDDPDDNGLTTWLPNGIFGNKSGDVDKILKFMNYYIEESSINIYNEYSYPVGPPLVDGVSLDSSVIDAVRVDMQSYFDTGKTALALEFMTPVKGTTLEQITVELLTGQISAEEAASAYDEDCLKQAVQLGLDW